jgi:hypothetical protein
VPIAVSYVRHFNTPAVDTPAAPTGPLTLGTEVGVPTGTTLTDRSTLGSPTASETFTITHPVTEVSAELTVSVWRDIRSPSARR